MKRLFIAVILIFSISTAFAQIVNKAEYFFDNDPGQGNGTPIIISNPGMSVSFPASIPVNLPTGFHWLAIRVKDSEGKWSLFQRRDFYVSQPATDLPIITNAEYFFDADPGVGNGTSLNFQTPGFSVSQTFPIAVPVNMAAGKHRLAIRVKDQSGHWSLFQNDTILVGGSTASITCPGNVVVTAASGQCASIVNNIDPIISPQGTSFTYSFTGATTGNGTGTASGKSFNVGVTTVTYALTDVPATSCSFSITVNSGTTASVSINTSTTSICAGQNVTFTTTPVNGGFTPSYQWKLNGNNIPGAIYSPYISSSLADGDVVSVVMTSSMSCASPSSATSNAITMTVHPIITPSVSISASATSICPGQSVTFTATPTNGGTQPLYQWVKNGLLVGSGTTVYQTSDLANGDSVYMILYNTTDCLPNIDITSNVIHITASQTVTPTVSITSTATTICTGQSVTFTATPTNGGANPVYEWMINNNAVGTNSNSFQTSSLQNGDVVKVSMVSSLGCANPRQAISNSLSMTVGASVTPSVTIGVVPGSSLCSGALAVFTASPVSGAGNSPTYQWKRNGVNISGATSSTYQSSTLQNGDVIRVAMTSSLSCANPKTVLSNDSATMVINSIALAPSVTILSTATNICQGQTVKFTAVPTNGGEIPGYQWKLNGSNIGENIDTFSTSSLQNGDVITVEMTTSVACATTPTAVSAPLAMNISTSATYYADLDGDGYGSSASGTIQSCGPVTGYVANNSDCNDSNAAVHPNATEICGNGIDDNCNGQIDENCTEGLPTLITKTYPVKEGDAGYTILNVEVKLDIPAIQPVSVSYITSNANATAGLDYVALNGVLTIPAGATSGIVQLKVIGDLLREDNEIFWLTFTNPVNVLLGSDPRTRIMIIDDDKGKPNSASPNSDVLTEVTPFKIPTVAKRNTVWMIPQIGNYENDVTIVNVQGQIVSRFINYKNQTSLGNIASGLYFYKIRIKESSGQYKYYSGRLLITE